jgi:CO/xanthine dehydrogenase Mo-binding subunit
MVAAETGTSPDEGLTAGSMSVQYSGAALRQVCAEVRAIYLDAAASELELPVEQLEVRDGEVTGPGDETTSFWKLADDALLKREATGLARPKAAGSYRVVGSNVPRVDIPDKVTGRPRYIHDLELPGLVFGRVVRPPSRLAELLDVDTASIEGEPEVLAVVRDGSFLGVVAEREEVAQRAAQKLRAGATWREHDSLPVESELADFLTSQPAETSVVAEDGEMREGTRAVSATYHRPYIAHASIAPSCAVALTQDGALEVWSATQGPYLLRRALSEALTIAEERITLRHVEGAGSYGHNGADDVALDAVLLARAVPGRPVKVLWSREDELEWEPFGPAAVVRVAADLDDAGAVLSWHHEIWGNGHVGRPGFGRPGTLLAQTHRAAGEEMAASGDPPLSSGGGAGRNSIPPYRFPAYQVVSHRLLTMPLRTSALRSLGALSNVFAAESFMDELALDAGVDPVDYRLRLLTDPRARAVIEAAARCAGWGERAPEEAAGQGIGFARYKHTTTYCAVVADVVAEREVRVRRLTIAVDAGLVVSPDGLTNQIEGGAIQATSWALKEQVRFDRRRVTSDTWDSYPILRFSEVPAVDVEILNRPDEPSVGAGEAAQGPTVAAIANAVRDAIGVRVRTLPLTPANVVAAMES